MRPQSPKVTHRVAHTIFDLEKGRDFRSLEMCTESVPDSGAWNDPRFRGDMAWNGPGSAAHHKGVLRCARDKCEKALKRSSCSRRSHSTVRLKPRSRTPGAALG